jgi:uncharacterized membrane protein YtjA (UPF0391 family)
VREVRLAFGATKVRRVQPTCGRCSPPKCSVPLHSCTSLSLQLIERQEYSKRHIFCFVRYGKGGATVLYYALVFLIVGLIAGVLGATGVAAVASQIAWILFIIGIILLVIHLATGRRGPVV